MILEITLENKKGKYYFCLDKKDYTLYLDEEEVLLQAGLIGEVQNVTVSADGEITTFSLFVSDKLVEDEKKKREQHYIFPVLIYALQAIYIGPIEFIFVANLSKNNFRSFDLWNENEGRFEDENDPEFEKLKSEDPIIIETRKWIYLIQDNVKVIQSINMVILALMILSMARLVICQKLKILAPATVMWTLFSIMYVADQFTNGWSYILGFTPFCFKSEPVDILGLSAFLSYQIFILTMVPFLVYQKFYIQLSYFTFKFVISIFTQNRYIAYKCFMYYDSQLLINDPDEWHRLDKHNLEIYKVVRGDFDKAAYFDTFLDLFALTFLLEVVYQAYRRRYGCFKKDFKQWFK